MADEDKDEIDAEDKTIPNGRNPNRGGIIQAAINGADSEGCSEERRKKQEAGEYEADDSGSAGGVEHRQESATGEQGQAQGAVGGDHKGGDDQPTARLGNLSRRRSHTPRANVDIIG